MSASIFVSRQLEATSPIQDIAIRHNLDITHQSLLAFDAVDFEVPDSKWLFFYSKTGVKYFSNYCSLSHYKVGCFGPATATYCMKYGHVTFECDADTKQAVLKVIEHIGDELITFVVGSRSLRSVQKALPSKAHHKETIVYNQRKIKKNDLGSYDIAILTSPMNVESFMESNGNAKKYIAIGETTATALRKRSFTPMVSVTPSEDGIAHTLDSILKTYF